MDFIYGNTLVEMESREENEGMERLGVYNEKFNEMKKEEVIMNEDVVVMNEEEETGAVSGQGGFTTVELIILLALMVVLIGFFKTQIYAFVNQLFAEIFAFDASVI